MFGKRLHEKYMIVVKKDLVPVDMYWSTKESLKISSKGPMTYQAYLDTWEKVENNIGLDRTMIYIYVFQYLGLGVLNDQST